MDTEAFDLVKSEKDKAMATFNRFRRIARLRQIFELVLVLAMVSWSSARAPAAMKTAAAWAAEASAYLFNHHVVFVIGNAIIVLLFVLCRRSDAAAGGGDFYDDYVKHSEAAAAASLAEAQVDRAPPPCPIPDTVDDIGAAVEKQIVVVSTEIAKPVRQCDDVSEAIEKATRQIKRFQRTQSDKLRREIGLGARAPGLRRSETQTRRGTADRLERLSSEEFRRTIDAFIDTHWSKKRHGAITVN